MTQACAVCWRVLPLSEFRAKRHRSGRVGYATDCNACHKAYNATLRKREAEEAGRTYRTRDELHLEREQRRAQKAARHAAWLAAQDAARQSKRTMSEDQRERLRKQKTRRKVERQRERYNNDPEYQAKVKAKKIRRKRLLVGALVENVNREIVVERDGWRCAICGKRVTRKTWSLDHVVPLSAGGAHSYHNVALAHRSCNSARGAGRLPSQAPLFATVAT